MNQIIAAHLSEPGFKTLSSLKKISIPFTVKKKIDFINPEMVPGIMYNLDSFGDNAIYFYNKKVFRSGENYYSIKINGKREGPCKESDLKLDDTLITIRYVKGERKGMSILEDYDGNEIAYGNYSSTYETDGPFLFMNGKKKDSMGDFSYRGEQTGFWYLWGTYS